jgi:kynureninase
MQFKVGTPNILSLAASEAGIDITLDASMLAIREKSLKIAKFIYKFVEDELGQHGVKVIGPANEVQRGGHITLHHPESWRICKVLQINSAPKIITDFRPESFLRVAITPLYTSFKEIAVFLDSLKKVLESRSYQNIDGTRPEVT